MSKAFSDAMPGETEKKNHKMERKEYATRKNPWIGKKSVFKKKLYPKSDSNSCFRLAFNNLCARNSVGSSLVLLVMVLTLR